MKRPNNSDALAGAGGLIAICPPVPEEKGMVYGTVGGFRSILDGIGEEEEEMMGDGEDVCSLGAAGAGGSLSSGEKKRRLSVDQVKALEKNFEVENKLEPERKVKLAQELGLQPRQVAVWFQNRRARWKTKQLERDYGVLKSSYETLKLNYDSLHKDKEALLAEIKELKAKLAGDGESSNCSIKEEPPVLKEEEENKVAQEGVVEEEDDDDENEAAPPLIYKDGSSDSDSSAILNDENSPHHLGRVAISSSPTAVLSHHHHHQLQEDQQKQSLMSVGFNCTSSSSSPLFQYSDGRGSGRGNCYFYQQQQQQLMRMEDHGFLGGEEPCSSSFFSDEQPPSLSWYCSDQWN